MDGAIVEYVSGMGRGGGGTCHVYAYITFSANPHKCTEKLCIHRLTSKF